jgi:hypothetical protein
MERKAEQKAPEVQGISQQVENMKQEKKKSQE